METSLKQQCKSLARALDLCSAWTVSDLASRLSELRGRPFISRPYPRPDWPGAVRAVGRDRDH